MTTPVGAEAFLQQQDAVANRADLRSVLPTISCPMAIIHGTADRLIPITAAMETATAVPNALYTAIEGAGHLLFHEQPTAARAAINEWLDTAS
jgi:pimeloyl-ACP methyl ester carboxylesterase